MKENKFRVEKPKPKTENKGLILTKKKKNSHINCDTCKKNGHKP